MKSIHFFLALSVAAFSGCSTSRNSQSTDNGYYSTGGSNSGYVSTSNGSDYYNTAPSDQYVQMRASDPARWSYFDDYYDYAFAPVGYGTYDMAAYGYGFGAPWITFGFWNPYTYWNSYYAWNSFYNPYYGAVVINNPKSPVTGLYAPVGPYSAANFTSLRNNSHGISRTISPYSQPLRNSGFGSDRNRGFYNGTSNDYFRSGFGQSSRSVSPASSSFGMPSGGGMRSGGGMGRSGH
jgi:hypothetical protein